MTHLVWDWNGTLLDDLTVVVEATNASFASVGGPVVTADEHRRDYRRPIVDYYAYVLGREVSDEEFRRLDRTFHEHYRSRIDEIPLATDALRAIDAWTGTQSLLSMWFHDELLPAVDARGLTERLVRIDGLRRAVGGDRKATYLAEHLDALGVAGEHTVLIGDSVDDAHAAQAVGARCVLYTGGFTDPDRLAAVGVPVARSLTEAVELARGPLLPHGAA